MRKLYLLLLFLPFIEACETSAGLAEETVEAYVPVYKSYEEMSQVRLDPSKKLEKSGKIYIYKTALLISEPGQGVHIFDNRDSRKQKRLNFIAVPGNRDMELKDNILYVDNGLDLVTIDISDIENIKVLNRTKDVFPYPMYPDREGVKFVCPDPSKGYVVDWVLDNVEDPKCYR